MCRTKRAGFTFVVVLLLRGGVACTHANENFREDVIDCEDAVAHVEACCPGVAAPEQACVRYSSTESDDCGCDGENGTSTHTESTWPVLDVDASKAIAAMTCQEMAANDGCARVRAQVSAPNSKSTNTTCGGGSSSEEYRT